MTTTTGRGLAVTGPKLIYTSDGKRCYAYSTQGSSLTSNAYSETLNFTSGDEYIVGKLTCFAPVDANPASGALSNYKVSFNGEVVFYINLDSAQEDHPAQAVVPMLIPPLTTVLIETNASASGWNPSVSFVGRVHG